MRTAKAPLLREKEKAGRNSDMDCNSSNTETLQEAESEPGRFFKKKKTKFGMAKSVRPQEGNVIKKDTCRSGYKVRKRNGFNS